MLERVSKSNIVQTLVFIAILSISPATQANTTKIPVSVQNQPDARIVTLRIPAPRGIIVDSNGKILAQNRIGYSLHLKLPFDQNLAQFVTEKQQQAEAYLKKPLSLSMAKIEEHYNNRRWISYSVNVVIEEKNKAAAAQAFVDTSQNAGWILVPVYLRHYPHGSLAAHVLGTVGKRAPLPRGPIVAFHPGREERVDPLWEETEGRDGLEKTYDKELRGVDGILEMYIDNKGVELSRRIIRNPVAGKNIVTSLNVSLQRHAETLLAQKKKQRSAFVLLDLQDGSIPVIASYPTFNPSDFVPSITEEEYEKLKNDKDLPLLARAWQGFYPPGSIFKIATTLAALEKNIFNIPWSELSEDLPSYVQSNTVLDCSPGYLVGKEIFRNWSPKYEGAMSVYEALMRSCNTWFYPVGISTGGDPILQMAKRLGLGQTVGLESLGETSKKLPFKKHYPEGEIANLAIGQGELLVSPLQAARMVAALVEGGRARKFRIVKELQSGSYLSGESVDTKITHVVKAGMFLVVNRSDGTGTSAAHPKMQVSGKTGTAQWGPERKKASVVWFAGFVPYNNPRYAFAVMLEGNDHQTQSGGEAAAPIIGQFLSKAFPDGLPD